EVKVSGEVTDGMHKIVIGGKDSVDEVLCSASTADDRIHPTQSMYVYATPAPKGSYTDYLTKTLLADAEVKLEDPVKFGGGTVYAWCVTPAPDSKGGCGADWVAGDNKLVLGMQLANDSVTAKQITAALEHELETLANRLGGDQATGTTVPGTADGTDVTTGGSGPVTTVDRTSTPSTVADGTTVDQPVTGSVRT
ncbi:MAG: hypothetical protein JWM12_3987, partial [Ilumatobacteraceae bacterium]|nr:hypothetical protein [Ilumatobacteraceae bacterium]